MAETAAIDKTGQTYAFPDAVPDEDLELTIAQKYRERAALEEQDAKEKKNVATQIYKTKERQLHYAEIREIFQQARTESLNNPGRVYVALDALNIPRIARGNTLKTMCFDGAVFYAAYLDGAQIPIESAAVMDTDDDGGSGDGDGHRAD